MRAFERSRSTRSYVVVAPRGRENYVRRIARRLDATKLSKVVPGGAVRSRSVQNGLDALPPDGYVAVHDAVRPMLTPAMVDAGFRACRRGPLTYGYPLPDSVKRVARGRVDGTVDRSGLYVVQTPQFFRLSVLREAHRRFGSTAATDDCLLVERLGIKPRVIDGPRNNIKVTTRQDLAVVRSMLCDANG